MSKFYPNAEGTLTPKVSTWKPRLNLTSKLVLSTDANGDMTYTDTVESTLTVGDFTGTYSGLATETNWTNNFTNAVSSNSGDRRFGVGANGSSYICEYSQSGWNRVYTDPFITDAALIAALETSSNWTAGGYYYNASSGDKGQKYRNGQWLYECIDGTNHTWIRQEAVFGYATIVDTEYIPTAAITIVESGDYFDIPIQHKVISVVSETQDTVGGNFQAGSSATAEVSNLEVTAGCSTNGNVTITLNGTDFTVALTTAQSSATLVATAIRNTAFTGYTTGGTGVNVTFTSNKFRSETDAAYSAGATGATGNMTTTVQGVNATDNIIASSALSGSANVLADETYIQLDSMLSISATKRIYFYIDSAALVKFRIVTQKF